MGGRGKKRGLRKAEKKSSCLVIPLLQKTQPPTCETKNRRGNPKTARFILKSTMNTPVGQPPRSPATVMGTKNGKGVSGVIFRLVVGLRESHLLFQPRSGNRP